jgi:hypothetical protein
LFIIKVGVNMNIYTGGAPWPKGVEERYGTSDDFVLILRRGVGFVYTVPHCRGSLRDDVYLG